MRGRRIELRGTVQGVGFRPWVYRLAREQGVTGRIHNDAAGVTIEAFGTAPILDRFVDGLHSSRPPAARIDALTWKPIEPEPVTSFRIVRSASAAERRVSIPADLATCAECASEIFDPTNRRYQYPFTNCTNCGPRFTIAKDIPYDRAATTMAGFPMCRECQDEYDSPLDRRFHAQPNACPACGPRLRALSGLGVEQVGADPLTLATRVFLRAGTVAVKGIGGFHLACDATSALAVTSLRERKQRDGKPFAVMVRDLAVAESLAMLTDQERELLMSMERPIVLVPRRGDSCLAGEVSPANPMVGILLPYSPLHHLLLARVGRPLVMTSGNLCEEPIAYRNDEAVDRLRGIADLFLVHDRDIVTRCDDSVVRVIAGAPVALRRARGYVPRAVPTRRPFERPVLACGAQLKNTFCIGLDDTAFFGPHIGDLENLETFRSFTESIACMEKFLRATPQIVAHDMHPDYLSTIYAETRSEAQRVAVQHHHAHVASAMAEHGLEGPVIGVVYDGTGHGTDGTVWGGEVLLVDYEHFERLATFRPIPLAGGDTAIRQVWRVALALLDDAFGGDSPLEALRLFSTIPTRHITTVRRMIERRVNTPLARGIGRYFDGLGAMMLGHAEARYEGHVAMQWNFAADANEPGCYSYALAEDDVPCTVDLRPLVREAVRDLLAGTVVSHISGKFHNTLVNVTELLVERATRQVGRLPVVLTGGCFQNALLAERVVQRLANRDVYLHGTVPPGDGGIALGQALIADAMTRRSSPCA